MSSFPKIADPYAHFVRTVLPNGLEIYSAYQPDKTWTAVRFVVHVGARHDPRDLAGLAHFLEHMVAANLPGKNLQRTIAWFERTGCGCYPDGTNYQTTRYGFRLPNSAQKMVTALEIFGGMLMHSPIDEHLERERRVINREFEKSRPRPVEIEWRLQISTNVFRGLWLENFDGPLGTTEAINAISEGDLRTFYDQFYIPANITVVTVGGIKPDQMAELLSNSPFGASKPGKRNLLPSKISELPVVAEPLLEVSTSDLLKESIDRAKLVVTWSYPANFSKETSMLFDQVLADIMFSELRQKHKAVYATELDWSNYHDIGECTITLYPDPVIIEKTKRILHDCIRSACTDLKRFRQCKVSSMRRFAMRDSIGGISLIDSAANELGMIQRISTLNEDYTRLQEVRFEHMAEIGSFLTENRAHTFILRP